MTEKPNKEKRIENVNGVINFAVVLLIIGLVVGAVYSYISHSIIIFLIFFGCSVFASAGFFAIAGLIDRLNVIIRLLVGPNPQASDPGIVANKFTNISQKINP